MDLNIKIKGSSNDRDLLPLYKRLMELGWDTIGWNQTVLGSAVHRTQAKPVREVALSAFEAGVVRKSRELSKMGHTGCLGKPTRQAVVKAKQEKEEGKQKDVTPSSDLSESFSSLLNYSRKLSSDVHQINRLTVHIDNPTEVQSLSVNNRSLAAFDILAAIPHSFKAFESLCREGELDIISLDLLNRLGFALNNKLVQYAQARGIYFEINIGAIFSNDPKRSNIFSSTAHLVQLLRGRNIIFSSGAEFANQLRGPFEYLNVAKMLGLNQEQAFNAIFNSTKDVLDHATARRNSYLSVEKLSFEDFLKTEQHIQKTVGSSKKTNYNRHAYQSDDEDSGRKKRPKKSEEDEDNSNQVEETDVTCDAEQEQVALEDEAQEGETEDDGFIKF